MKKFLIVILTILIAFPVMAQLPTDPWAQKTAQQQKKLDQVKAKSRKTVNFKGQNPNNVPLPKYVGETTTWNTAMGQREIAPDVNITNMLLMTQHLRNVGYQIPTGLDQVISNAPANLRRKIMGALNYLKSSNHPVAVGAEGMSDIFEKYTGFSIPNLIENSIRIIDARR